MVGERRRIRGEQSTLTVGIIMESSKATGKDTTCLLESMSWHPIKLQTTTPNGAGGGKSDKTLVIFSDQKGPDSMRLLHQEA